MARALLNLYCFYVSRTANLRDDKIWLKKIHAESLLVSRWDNNGTCIVGLLAFSRTAHLTTAAKFGRKFTP